MVARACFADNADLPIACAWDVDECHNCTFANNGVHRDYCPHWQPDRAVDLAKDILGGEWQLVKHEVICARCGIRQDGPSIGMTINF